MSNEKKTESQEIVKTKLPQLDGEVVEEIPAGDLDDLSGGCLISNNSNGNGNSSNISKPKE